VSPQIVEGQSVLAFTGPSATALYGGPVPLTVGSYAHLGNPAPLPGTDLIPDLMNGVAFTRGTRYHITPLDLAMLRDLESTLPSGVADLTGGLRAAPMLEAPPPLAVPEPSTWLLMVAGLALPPFALVPFGLRTCRSPVSRTQTWRIRTRAPSFTAAGG
jgi:hypothetical protein